MTTRDDLFQKFGPLLIEAIALATLDQINALRSTAGLPQITYSRAIDEISNHLTHLDEYSWMEGPSTPFRITDIIEPLSLPIKQVQPTSKLSLFWQWLRKLRFIFISED